MPLECLCVPMNEKINILRNTPSLWQYRDLVLNLVNKEIKVYYMGTWLGFAWSHRIFYTFR